MRWQTESSLTYLAEWAVSLACGQSKLRILSGAAAVVSLMAVVMSYVWVSTGRAQSTSTALATARPRCDGHAMRVVATRPRCTRWRCGATSWRFVSSRRPRDVAGPAWARSACDDEAGGRVAGRDGHVTDGGVAMGAYLMPLIRSVGGETRDALAGGRVAAERE